MTDVPIHLAFPDATLAYDCEACDQRCCKTSALAIFPAEIGALIKRLPALELVAPADASTIALFGTPPSGCWFLANGRCELYPTAPGQRTPRPRACDLFPFNLFGTLGEALVVAPNGLCPLRVAPGHGVTHDEVAALLRRHGAAGAPPATLRPEGEELLALERVIRAAASASLEESSPVPLVAFAELATEAWQAGGAEAVDAVDLTALPERIDATYDALDRAILLLAIEEPSPEAFAAVAPVIAAWTPTLRLFAFDTLPVGHLPRALLLLGLYAAHWQHLRLERPLVPQTLMQMVSSLGPTIELLCAWDEPWRGPKVPGVALRPGEIPAEALAEAFGPADPDDPAPHQRTLLLRRLAEAHARTPGDR